MEQAVMEFQFEGHEIRSLIGEDGEPWFVGE